MEKITQHEFLLLSSDLKKVDFTIDATVDGMFQLVMKIRSKEYLLCNKFYKPRSFKAIKTVISYLKSLDIEIKNVTIKI